MSDKKPLLLVIDDEPDIREIIVSLMESDFFCLEASNGVEALGLVQSHAIDVLLTDVTMPELSGTELVEKLENLEVNCSIFVLSGCVSEELMEWSGRWGVHACIEKPFDPVFLRNMLLSSVTLSETA